MFELILVCVDIDLKKVILKAHALLEGDPICSEDYLKGRVNSERRSRLGKHTWWQISGRAFTGS